MTTQLLGVLMLTIPILVMILAIICFTIREAWRGDDDAQCVLFLSCVFIYVLGALALI